MSATNTQPLDCLRVQYQEIQAAWHVCQALQQAWHDCIDTVATLQCPYQVGETLMVPHDQYRGGRWRVVRVRGICTWTGGQGVGTPQVEWTIECRNVKHSGAEGVRRATFTASDAQRPGRLQRCAQPEEGETDAASPVQAPGRR